MNKTDELSAALHAGKDVRGDNPLVNMRADDPQYEAVKWQRRAEYFELLARNEQYRSELAIRLLKDLHRNPNLLSGRRRIRVFLRERWNILLSEPSGHWALKQLEKAMWGDGR